MQRILISACLLGRPVRYDGRGRLLPHPLIAAWQAEGRLVAVCPEMLGGFPTPRPPAEIEPGHSGGDVLDGRAQVVEATGGVVTAAFLDGAEAALEAAQAGHCPFALLTDGSPSCGSTFIYGGRFDGGTHPGMGVVAALLRRHGIRVFAESEIEVLAALLE